jgi:hypothetical protein
MGASDLLAELAGAGLSVRADGERLVIRPASKLTDELRAALVAAKPELLALLTGPPRPYRLTKAQGDAAHAEPRDDAACARFVARVALFMRRRINVTDADDLAERLHLRDVQGDDRGMCLECERLDMRGRCQAAAAGEVLGVDRRLEPVPTILLRCEAFEPSKELA